MNLLTRLNWEWRVAVSDGRARVTDDGFRRRLDELADYLLFVGEATPVVEVTPRPGFAARLAAAAPKDSRGRSLAELDLVTRLMRYPVSYMVYSTRSTAWRRGEGRGLSTAVHAPGAARPHAPACAPGDAGGGFAAAILRETKTDLAELASR